MEGADHQVDVQYMSEDSVDYASEQRGDVTEPTEAATYRETTVTSIVPTKALDRVDGSRAFYNAHHSSAASRPSTSGTAEESEAERDLIDVREQTSQHVQEKYEQVQEPVSIGPLFSRNDDETSDATFAYGKPPSAQLDLTGNRQMPSATRPTQQLQASGFNQDEQDGAAQDCRESLDVGGLAQQDIGADDTADPSSDPVSVPEQRSSSPAMQSSEALYAPAEVEDSCEDWSPDGQPQYEMEVGTAPAISDDEYNVADPPDVNDVDITDSAPEDGRESSVRATWQEKSRAERPAQQSQLEETFVSDQSPNSRHPANDTVVASSTKALDRPLAMSTVVAKDSIEKQSEILTLYNAFGSKMQEHEKQLMAKHSSEQHALQSRLDQVAKEKSTVEKLLADVQQQSKSHLEELRTRLSKTAGGLNSYLENLGMDYLGLKDASEEISEKTTSLFASSSKIESRLQQAHRVNSKLVKSFGTIRARLSPIRQDFEASLKTLQEHNQALTMQLGEKVAQVKEQHDRSVKLEKHLEEQSRLPTTLVSEVRALLEASEKTVTTQLDALGTNVSKQYGASGSALTETLRRLRDDMETLTAGNICTTQNLLTIKDTVQGLVESASNRNEHRNNGHDTLDAVNDLKSGLEMVLQPIADEVKALRSHLKEAEAQRVESADLQQRIQDRDARLLAEHATTTRLQTEIHQLKSTLDSRPMQDPNDSRQNFTHAHEEQKRLLDASRAELSVKVNELAISNAGLKDLEAEKEALRQRLNTLESAASDFGAEKLELQRKMNEALTTKEREMCAVAMRAQAAERARSDNEIKRLTKELESSMNALEASRRTSMSAKGLNDNILVQAQRIEDLERLQADEASLRSAHDILSSELSTLKSQLSETNTQKVSALQKQAEAQRLLSEAQTSEKQCRSDLQQSRAREANIAGEADRLATRQKANLDQVKQSYAERTEVQSAKHGELVGQHAAHIEKLRAESDEAIKQAEDRVEKAESALKALESRFENENNEIKDRLSKVIVEKEHAVASMQTMRKEAEAMASQRNDASRLSPLGAPTAGEQQEASLTTESEVSRPRKHRKIVDRTAEPIYRGPIVEETQSTNGTIGVFSQIARAGSQAQRGQDLVEVDEMLDNAILSSQHVSFEASQLRAIQSSASRQAGSVVEETQLDLEGSLPAQSPPTEKTATRAKLPSLRGKLVESESHSEANRGWSPGPRGDSGVYADGQDRHSSLEDELHLGVEHKQVHRKPFAKPNSASKMAPRRPQDHGEAMIMHGAMEDQRVYNHEAASSSPAFVASQTNAVSRTNTYQAPGSAGRLSRASRTPSAPSTIDPRLLQKSSQLSSTSTLKRRASTALSGNAESQGDARKKFHRTNTKVPAMATSPPSQHTRLRQSANDLPTMPQAAPRARGMREDSANTSAQSRIRTLAGNAGTPRSNKRGKKSSKNDEINARFDRELSSHR